MSLREKLRLRKKPASAPLFYPDHYFDSVLDIPFEELYRRGYRGVMFDIDNTLVPHNAPANERARAFMSQLREIGYKTCLISNNREKRVEPFARELGTDFVCMAWKPFTGGYKRGMDRIGTRPDNTIFVGDQIFTDVIGARKLGILTILVKPINPKEEIQIILKRIPEKAVLFFYQRVKSKKGVNRRRPKNS